VADDHFGRNCVRNVTVRITIVDYTAELSWTIIVGNMGKEIGKDNKIWSS